MNDIKPRICQGTVQRRYLTITRSGWEAAPAEIIREQLACIFVNGHELVSVMCTPCDLEAMALGFLANEGIIAGMQDIRTLDVRPNSTCVDIWLAHADFKQPERRTLTSGCGGGVTFEEISAGHAPLDVEVPAITPSLIWEMVERLQQAANLYSRARGVHTAAISDGRDLLLVAEDVGRHNTLDKLRGLALLRGLDTTGCMLLTTGRVSSEMINKARHMAAPIVCSRTSPTSLSIALAEAWNITLAGYVRRNSMNIYAHPERIDLSNHDGQPEE